MQRIETLYPCIPLYKDMDILSVMFGAIKDIGMSKMRGIIILVLLIRLSL